MADPPPYPDSNGDTGDDTRVRPDRGSPPGIPLWMKVSGIIVIALVLVFVILKLTGLGGDHGPGRHIPSGDAGGDTPAIEFGSVGWPANADETARTVEVTALDTMTFEPSRINVSAGETVTFVVTNTGQIVHEFTLGDAAMQQERADMMAHMPAGVAHDLPNSIKLQPGETKQLNWRFGDTGTLEYGCHEPGHYQAGMRGQIAIN